MADHDFDEIDDTVEPSRERVPRSPRLLIITLSVGCVALALSNIALATRVTQLRRATVVDRPAVARAPIETPPAAAEQASPEPAAAASIPSQTAPRVSGAPDVPPPTAPHVASAPEAAPAPTSIPSTPERETTPGAAARELPPRATPRAQQRVASAQRTSERVVPGPSTPERATASWMVHEYGRLDAEARARSVADFYGAKSPEGAYWRRVLGEIVTARR